LSFGHCSLLASIALYCCAAWGREIRLSVDLPASCAQPSAARLELDGVEFPRNRAANIRVYASPAAASEVYFGLLAIMAESAKAEGVRKGDALRVEAEPPFLDWLKASPRTGKLTFVFRPFAGKKPATDLEWKVTAATLACR
jgi:hypothetical protein